MQQNTNGTKYKKDKNAKIPKYKHDKIQMVHNTNTTK